MWILLTGCAAHRDRQILDQAKALGTAEAGISIPDLPAECREKFPHAALITGQELAVLLARERGQLDKANQRTDDCADAWDLLKAKLEKQIR